MGLVRVKLCVEDSEGNSGLSICGGEARNAVEAGRLAALRVVDIERWGVCATHPAVSPSLLDLILFSGESIYLTIPTRPVF